MDKLQLLSYKNRLLNLGVPYAVMKRNLRELQDHHDDLLQQALAKGMTDADAKAAAAQQLGDFEQLVNAILARPELRSKLHRYPFSMTILLPLLAHFVVCALLLFALLYPAVATRSLEGAINLQESWLVAAFELLKITLMYIITPLMGCYLAFLGIRDHVPQHFWVTGLMLLCLLGSTFHMHVDWGDPETGRAKSVGATYSPGFQQPAEDMGVLFALRFAFNLLLCGAFARAYNSREQAAVI